MKIGLVSDMHLGYHHGSRVHAGGPMAGINVREADFISAAQNAIGNLVAADVDIIVDGGDIAHVPAPKKRAIAALIDIIRRSGKPFFSADGNHTSLKSTSDIHLYDILRDNCPNFKGATEGIVVKHDGLWLGLVPHSYDPEETRQRVINVSSFGIHVLVGHWAASDIQYDSAQVPIEALPDNIPVFLGHYHKHVEQDRPFPTYIGSTERTAWDQWDYPTGVSVYDTDTKKLTFIQHETRHFVNLLADKETYIDSLDREDLEGAVVRLTVTASATEYGALNLGEAKRKAYSLGALTYHHRRAKDKDSQDPSVETYEGRPIEDAWQEHVKSAKLPKGVKPDTIKKIGLEAMSG